MNILQSIFTDYYEHIIYKLHPRPSVIENVNKKIHCGDPSHGGAMYGCPHCGNKYNQLRSFHISCKLVSCVHRHCEMEFLISTLSSPRVGLVTSLPGVLSNTLITISFVMPSVKFSLNSLLPALVHLFVKLKMKCTPDTKTTKLLLKLFLLWTSSRN